MKRIFLLLLALFLIDEYSIGEFLVDPPLRYLGMGRGETPIVLYDPSVGDYLYIPSGLRGRFVFEFNGMVYEIIPTNNMKIQVYRR